MWQLQANHQVPATPGPIQYMVGPGDDDSFAGNSYNPNTHVTLITVNADVVERVFGVDALCDPESISAILLHKFDHLMTSIAATGLPGSDGGICVEMVIKFADLARICDRAASCSDPGDAVNLCWLYEKCIEWIDDNLTQANNSCPGQSWSEPSACASCS